VGHNPGFPVKFGDKDKLYAAFLNESRTRGPLLVARTGNPGISLVFREVWDSEDLNGFAYEAKNWGFSGRGIPHLAKSEWGTHRPWKRQD
jgi:hypothetical protein